MDGATIEDELIRIVCVDGYVLGGHLWRPNGHEIGTVIINPATGVLARYYHRYARFLAESGFAAITYDYRGIGLSRPKGDAKRPRGFAVRWADWGTHDFEAVVRFARMRDGHGLLTVVGHSIGGVLIGYAESAPRIDRILTVGAQYGYWRDYRAGRRLAQVLRWHVAMPAITMACGYFPGQALGWLEDLPKGVALDWAWRRSRLDAMHPPSDRGDVLARFAAVRAPILAIGMTDDDYATKAGISRALAYFAGAERRFAMLNPAMLDAAAIGHFALFHSKHREPFWTGTRALVGEGCRGMAVTPFQVFAGANQLEILYLFCIKALAVVSEAE